MLLIKPGEKPGNKPLVCMTGGPYLSEARAGQCPAPRRQRPKLEALFAAPDRFWAGQRLCDHPVWPIFLSGALNKLYGPFTTPTPAWRCSNCCAVARGTVLSTSRSSLSFADTVTTAGYGMGASRALSGSGYHVTSMATWSMIYTKKLESCSCVCA